MTAQRSTVRGNSAQAVWQAAQAHRGQRSNVNTGNGAAQSVGQQQRGTRQGAVQAAPCSAFAITATYGTATSAHGLLALMDQCSSSFNRLGNWAVVTFFLFFCSSSPRRQRCKIRPACALTGIPVPLPAQTGRCTLVQLASGAAQHTSSHTGLRVCHIHPPHCLHAPRPAPTPSSGSPLVPGCA
jgi:hypothetical protein